MNDETVAVLAVAIEKLAESIDRLARAQANQGVTFSTFTGASGDWSVPSQCSPVRIHISGDISTGNPQ